MALKRIVASVTWGQCSGDRPHLGELIIFEGGEEDTALIMRQDNFAMWKARTFRCLHCPAQVRLIPTALMFEDA